MESIPFLEVPDIELDIEMVSGVYLYMSHFLPCIGHLWYMCGRCPPRELKCYRMGQVLFRSDVNRSGSSRVSPYDDTYLPDLIVVSFFLSVLCQFFE